MQITTAEVLVVGNVAAWVGAAFHHYQLGQKVKAFLVKDAPIIAEVGTKVIAGAVDVLKSPVLAPVELKLHHTLSDLADSRLAHLASAGLLAARGAFGKVYEELSANEKAAIVNVIKAELAKVDPNVTAAEIAAALDDARKFADKLGGSDVFKNTSALEESLKALLEPAPAQVAQ